MIQRILPFVLISALGIFGLVSTTMLISTDINSSYFKIYSLISQVLQSVRNTNHGYYNDYNNKVTLVGKDSVGDFSWIPKYVLGIDNEYDKFFYSNKPHLKSPIKTKSILLVLDKSFVKSVLGSTTGDQVKQLQLLYRNSTSIGTFDDNGLYSYTNRKYPYISIGEYPYTSIVAHNRGLGLIEVRAVNAPPNNVTTLLK